MSKANQIPAVDTKMPASAAFTVISPGTYHHKADSRPDRLNAMNSRNHGMGASHAQ